MNNLAMIILTLFLASCNPPTPVNQEVETTVTQQDGTTTQVISGKFGPTLYKTKMSEIENYTLVDIRTPGELAENGTMEGALNIDYYAKDFKDKMNQLNKDEAVFIYCRSGGRSGDAMKLLTEWGFKEVYDLDGGFNAWLNTYGE